MNFRAVNQINPIGAMKPFTKPNCNICMEKHLTIIKTFRDENVTLMNKNSEIYRACRHKTTFRQFFLTPIVSEPLNQNQCDHNASQKNRRN